MTLPYEIALGVALAAAWGFVCGIGERLILAPRRRLSTFGPAYCPAMLFAFFMAGVALGGEQGFRPFFAALMAIAAFAIGALPALAAFHLSRRLLRTRFSDPKPN